MTTNDTCCTICPYFRINPEKEAAFRTFCEEVVAKTSTEPKCLYYGFSFDGDQAFCREGYADAEGALAHLENVGPILTAMLLSKTAELIRLEIHGPETELAKLRGPLAAMNPQYFVLEYGFRR